MRYLASLALAALLGANAATTARADSLAEPSSTIPGCVNNWSPLGAGSGVAGPTCEGKAALAEWNEHAAAVNAARDTLVDASNRPDQVAPIAVIDALDACAAAADAMARLDPPADRHHDDFAAVLTGMRPWFEHHRLLVPDTIGDGFHTLTTALARPGLLRADRTALYGQAAASATQESALAAALGPLVVRQTDEAVRAAHRAAVEMARLVATGHPQSDAGAAIRAAAGPGYPAIAEQQAQQLDQSLAAQSDRGSHAAQAGWVLGMIPNALLWIAGLALVGAVAAFPRLAARLGPADAVKSALLFGLALPSSWLPFALLRAATGWPDGRLVWLLWLALLVLLLAAGPRLLPGRLRTVWAALFAAAPPTAHGSHAGRAAHRSRRRRR